MEKALLNKREYQRQYRVSGIVIFAMAVLVLLVRIISYYISDLFAGMDEYAADFALDTVFTLMVQVLILFVMPFLVYKFALKKSTKDVFTFSNFRKTKPINLLLAVIIGVVGIVVTIGISFFWQIILIIFGYMPQNSATAMPENFSIWLFLGSIFLTAVLPGFCEEFTMRGGFLTVLRTALPITSVIMVSALAFGLFHQYIIQTFYTACFGGLMAFLTIRSKSIYPAMVVHFINNGLSVYLDYAQAYRWVGGGFFQSINDMLMEGKLGVLFFSYVAIFVAFALIIYMFAKINPKNIQKPVLLDESTEVQPVPSALFLGMSNLDSVTVKKAPLLEIDRKILPRTFVSAYGDAVDAKQRILFVNNRYYLIDNCVMYALKPKPPFKPTFRDNIFFIGAIVVSVLSTIFTFVWGFIV